MLDATTNADLGTWNTGTYNYDVAVDPLPGDVWVSDVSHNLLQHLSGVDGHKVAQEQLQGFGYSVALDVVRQRAFVAQGLANRLAVVNMLTHAVEGQAPVGNLPFSVDVDPVLGRVFVANSYGSSMSVYDEALQSVLTFRLSGSPSSVAVNPLRHEAYVALATRDEVLTLDTVSYGLTDVVPLGRAPQGLSVDPLTGRGYVALFNTHRLGIVP